MTVTDLALVSLRHVAADAGHVLSNPHLSRNLRKDYEDIDGALINHNGGLRHG